MLFMLSLTACGGDKNAADCDDGISGVPCSPLEKEESARKALDQGDFDTAIELLEQLVEEEPEDYQRYTLLSAAYAARAGFAILSVVKANFGGEGGGLIGQISAFLPDPAERGAVGYQASIADMAAAVARLTAIPAALRAEDSGEKYASSAQLQLMLYQSAYSIMYLNQFTISASTGAFDPSLLETMTEQDATVVLTNLAAASAQEGSNPELQVKIDEALASINGQSGGSNRDRLAEYIRQEQGQ